MLNEVKRNNQDLSTDPQTPETNPQTEDNRFEYMDQKPHYSRKELTILGVALALILLFIIGGVCFVTSNALEALAQSQFGWLMPGLLPDSVPETEEKMFAGTNVSENLGSLETDSEGSANDDTPEYTERPIALAIYEVDEEDVLVTTSSDEEHAGYYVLKPGTVYAIRWDASPLYRNKDGKVDANIEISSDFLIGGGIDGEGVITVNIRDYYRHIDYIGELHIDVKDANLGIEFCANQCRVRAYGFSPEIRDGKFTVCFYTSGEYAESVCSSASSVDGYYRYTYSVNGSEYSNDAVTQPEDVAEHDSSQSTSESDPRVPVPMPTPTPMPMPEPLPLPTPMPKPQVVPPDKSDRP